MHAVFQINGKRELVEKYLTFLETRMGHLPFENPNLNVTGPQNKDGDLLRKGVQPITCVLRYGFLGTYEFIFPENNKDAFLTFLDFHKTLSVNKNTDSKLKIKLDEVKMKARVKAMQLALGCEPIPEFKEDYSIIHEPELKQWIRILPIGVRYDAVTLNSQGILREAL